MTARLAATTGWLLAGAAITAGLFWAFLNTPESTIWMLAMSLLLVVAMYAASTLTWSGALVGWARGFSGDSVRRAGAGLGRSLPPVLLVAIVWWMVGRALGWLDAHAGEISAWFIAQFDWADVRPLLTGVHYGGEWLRTIVAPFAALVWLGVLLDRGWRPLIDRACVSHAFSPARVLAVTAIAVGTIVLPLAYGAYWMPRGLPATWIEPAVAALKFAVLSVLAAVGLSLIARLAIERRDADEHSQRP